LKFAQGWASQLAIVVVASFLVGYLTVETLNAVTGAFVPLPLSRALVVNLGLGPVAGGAVTGAILAGIGGSFVYWVSIYNPEIFVRYFRTARPRQRVPLIAPSTLKADEFRFVSNGNGSSDQFVDVFPIEGAPLNVYAAITKEEGREGYKYVVIEPTLTDEEKARLEELKKVLVDELDVDLKSIETKAKAEEYLAAKVKEIVRTYGYKISSATMKKFIYYLSRDFIRLGKIEPLMRDKLIEDISCDGARIPIYVWYRDYESIPSNIVFETDAELDTYVSKLAYAAGKHVSLAEPIVDASLEDGSRLHLTYGKEVTQKGSTFTIRKFRADPLTIVDLIKYNTMSSDIAAYLWYLIEKKLALLVAGGTASGKTTSLNALSMFIAPGQKVISVEDSVTGDSEILLKERGAIRKERIGKFVDEALKRGAVTTEMGHRLARTDGLQVLTSDASGKTLWSPCTALIRHRVKKAFVKVITRTGKVIEVTADHSVFSPDGEGNVTEVRAGDLVRGSFVVAPSSLPREYTRHQFDLGGLPEFSEFVFKAHPTTSNGNGLVLESRVHAKHSPLSIPSQISLDEDLAFLAGLWVADGFYGERTVGFSAGGKDLEAKLRAVAAKLGLNLTRHSDGVSLLMNSKPLRLFFESVLGLSGDDYSRHVPDLFYDSDDAVVSSFLRGYFSGDGSVSASEIQVESASRQLLVDVQTLLLRFGIRFAIGLTRKVGSLGGIGTFRGCVVGTSQVARFAEKVGFEQASKMAGITSRPKTSKYFLDPVPLSPALSDEIKAAKKGLPNDALRQRLNKGMRRKVIARQSLLDLGEVNPAYKSSRGYSLAKSQYFFEEVVEVERSTREEEVYDLSVPETGRFIANNLICHNTPELNLPHENWIQSVTRGVGTAAEITMFDLLKASLRQRPDVIIVGEVRGEEAFTLMQSIATGHGGLGTIHADSVEAVINRLTTEPMNIPKSLLGSALDCIAMQLKIRLVDKSVRRVTHIAEVIGHDPRSDQIILNDAFKWDPVSDKFTFSGRSRLFDKITQKYGTKPEEIRRDIDGRKLFLDWLVAKNIRSYDEVSKEIGEFYGGPYAVINKAKIELEEKAA